MEDVSNIKQSNLNDLKPESKSIPAAPNTASFPTSIPSVTGLPNIPSVPSKNYSQQSYSKPPTSSYSKPSNKFDNNFKTSNKYYFDPEVPVNNNTYNKAFNPYSNNMSLNNEKELKEKRTQNRNDDMSTKIYNLKNVSSKRTNFNKK